MNRYKQSLYNIMEKNDVTPVVSSVVNKILIALILLNVAAATFETVPDLNQSYKNLFIIFEVFSVLIFTIEYGLRVWISSENKSFKSRWAYIKSAGAIIDFVSIAPFYISIVLGFDIKVLIILRLLRLLKLIRYFEPLGILGRALKAEFSSFMSALFILFILIMIASTGMYLFEKEAQPDLFGSIPQSMWWSVVTLTTLGYGDVIPVTIAGKVFAGLITILSIGTVALPAGMLASRFSEELKNRKEAFKDLAASLQKDGHLCNQSLQILEESRLDNAISKDTAEHLIQDACQKEQGVCSHCGLSKHRD